MATPLLGSRAQPAHVLVDEPNLPAQRVDAVAPTFALLLALLQCGALRRDLSDTRVQLATQPLCSLLGVGRSTLQLVKLPLLYCFGCTGRLEQAPHLFCARRSSGLGAKVSEMRLGSLQDAGRLRTVVRVGLNGRDPPAQLCPSRVERDAWIGTRPHEPCCSVHPVGGDVAADDHAAEQ